LQACFFYVFFKQVAVVDTRQFKVDFALQRAKELPIGITWSEEIRVMFKQFRRAFSIFSLGSGLALAGAPAASAELTAMETRWLQAAAPVLAYARSLALPIDIVVQPKAGANDVPMAMGFAGRRCKLVLSMRGDSNAEGILARIPASQRSLMIEAMAAHEIAHCWRYVQGVWHALPAGFVDTEKDEPDATAPRLAAMARALREMRREEGFSDLVALAWTASKHPDDYAAVHGWLRGVRADQGVGAGGHDTMIWIMLARDPAAFKRNAGAFEGVDALWTAGLEQAR
jgi:hypothetical protein